MNRFARHAMVALFATLAYDAALAAVFNVSTTTDGGPGSLRQAIIDANAAAGADTINVPAGTYVLSIAGASEDAAATGDLDITDSVTINGGGSSSTSVEGGIGFGDRIFHVIGAGTVVSLNGLSIKTGSAGASSSGGGIANVGVLTLSDVVVAQNSAGIQGGGIFSTGTLTLTSSVVRNNSGGQGGGVFTTAFTATDCTIANNSGPEQGGGIFVAGTFSIERCTIDNNTAGDDQGGGMFVIIASGTLTNVTISNNTAAAGSGGGIFNNPPRGPPENLITIVNSTISNNAGGGLRSFGDLANFSLLNTIVTANGQDCPNTNIASQGFNLITDTTTCTISGVTTGNILGVGANLGPLADNGGPTQTRGLNAGSPAIDAATAVGAPPTDQRGVARPVGAGFDIGAFEGTLGGGALPTLSIDNVSANEGNGGNTAFTFTVTLSAASASTVTVNFTTADGTALAGSDYAANNGIVTFAPGQTTQPIVIQVSGDLDVEANETFLVNLSNAANATIATGQGTGTIVNDDTPVVPPPAPSVAVPTLSEWALLLLALLLAGSAIQVLRRRR